MDNELQQIEMEVEIYVEGTVDILPGDYLTPSQCFAGCLAKSGYPTQAIAIEENNFNRPIKQKVRIVGKAPSPTGIEEG